MSESTQQEMATLMDQAERIGVIGSPSSTAEIALDILASAVNRKLVGELALFRYLQDSAEHYALGQITDVTLRNIWHEDPTMRSLIRQRGRVDAVSERQDTHLAEMTVSAVFAQSTSGYQPSILGTVPATGTAACIVDDRVLEELLSPYEGEIFYLGQVYGSTPKLPMWFKHFGSGAGGAGEAYHLGIFGKTGSGKSVLAKMILPAYAKHPEMAIIIIDPQGEFAKEARGEQTPGEFQLPISEVLHSLNRRLAAVAVRDLVLDRWELFEQILYESPFFERLTIPRGENRQLAASVLVERLRRARVTLTRLHGRNVFEQAWTILGEEETQRVFYRTEGSRHRFQSALDEADKEVFYGEYWHPVTELFRGDRQGARTVDSLLRSLFDPSIPNRPVIIVDLSSEQADGLFWNESIEALVVDRLLQGIRVGAEQAYRENRGLNTLVIIDEAHRLAPRERFEIEHRESVRRRLVDAVRTTRKYGVGWMFISQTLSSLHREVVQQLRIFFFGFGLSMGSEFQALRELVGGRGKALDLYQLFRDPHSSFDTESREYSFMSIGPVSPLSFSGTPLFFNAFNTVADFLEANQLSAREE